MNENEMPLADRVRQILDEMEGREHGKKARLAAIAGCTPPVVNHWLGSQQEMKFEHAKNISTSLGYRIEWLLTGRGPARPHEGEDLLKGGIQTQTELLLPEVTPGDLLPKPADEDVYLKVNADELKLIHRYRNATQQGKFIIEAASIHAPKDIPGKH